MGRTVSRVQGIARRAAHGVVHGALPEGGDVEAFGPPALADGLQIYAGFA
jgi:hypothetical protein